MSYTIILIDKYGEQKLPSTYISKRTEGARLENVTLLT